MSSSKGKQLIHPFVYLLVDDGVNAIFLSMKQKRYRDALQDLWSLFSIMDQEFRDGNKDVFKRIEHYRTVDIAALSDGKEMHKLVTVVLQYLHSHNYLVSQRYEVPKRETSLKEMERRLETHT
jgi:hypothetical protein